MDPSPSVGITTVGQPTAIDAAVVLCTRDRPDMLATALAALVPASAGAEVIVVDSASVTSATRLVAERAGVRYVRSEVPGLSRARNLGLHSTERALVVFTDDDCTVDAQYLPALLAPFAAPDVAVVTGLLRDISDTSPAPAPTADVLTRVGDGIDAGHGALMAFRRSALLETGGFDPLLGAGRRFGGAEDLDAFCRLLESGTRLVRASGAVVTHVNTREDDDYVRLNANYGRGLGAMLAKWQRTHGGSGWALTGIVARRALSRAVRRAGSARGRSAQRAYIAGLFAGYREARRLPLEGENFVDSVAPAAATLRTTAAPAEELPA